MAKQSKTYIATPPGATIKEQLETRGMSQKEFALRMDMSEKHISRLINGEVQLTQETAYRLEAVLGLPARFWNNLESIYREKLIKVDEENMLDADIEVAKKMPYNEMAKYNWVPATRNVNEKVSNLRKFFEVINLGLLKKDSLIPVIACRRLSITEKADYALLAWAQRAKVETRSIHVSPINLKKLRSILPKIRKMTLEAPDQFCSKLKSLLSECGIALIFLPHINGSFLHGATFYDMNKIVMGVTVRGKDADKFWFSLFHELGHVILGHINKENGINEQDEKDADNFAQEVLIPNDVFQYFINQRDFTKLSIIAWAKNICVDAGIVVGRLQKENCIRFDMFNELKQHYELK